MILKIVTIIQARTSSTRLPNKVLLSAAGKPLLLHMIKRIERSKYCGTVVVATTPEIEDDSIEELCINNNIECFRGHPTDLLDRHYQVSRKYDADAVIKIPSDCPLIDPNIIDKIILFFLQNINKYDYVSNLRPPSYPDGNDVEIFTSKLLEFVWENAAQTDEREHTTPYIWKNPQLFKIGNVSWGENVDYSQNHRWTIDYEEDYTFIRLVFEELYNKKPNFDLYDILNLLREKPYISKINNIHKGKFWYNNHNFQIPEIN